MFCEVERSYIEDGFNLYGLRACVSNFSDCLDLILDRIGPDDSDDSHLTQNACTLYGLIHARYIITAHGLDAMYNKVRFTVQLECLRISLSCRLLTCIPLTFLLQYAGKEFGTCPLVQCSGQPVLPVGLKDEIGADTVKIFCPKCQCVYHPPVVRHRSHHGSAGNGGVDGASFGTTFPHLFLMTFSNLVPDPLPANSAYVPRVFGFRVHSSAHQRNVPAPAQIVGSNSRRNANRLPSAGYAQDVSRSETAAASASLPARGETLGKQSGTVSGQKKPSADETNRINQTKRRSDNGAADASAKRIKR